jgi:hypothetical protein
MWSTHTLQLRARPNNILRVVEVRPGGAVVLQGKCGTSIVHQNNKNLAPCHSFNIIYIDPTVDVTLQPIYAC